MTEHVPFILNARFETLTHNQVVSRLGLSLLDFQIAKSGCDPEDEDALSDQALDGLSHEDMARVIHRAKWFLKKRQQSSGLAHLRESDLENLTFCKDGVELRGPKSAHAVDVLASTLTEEMPWMTPAIIPIWREARARVKQGRAYGHRPVLLVGPPGIGKTYLAHRLAELVGTPSAAIDVAAASDGFSLAGVARGWGSAMPGRPVSTILASGCGNPTIFIDEIDKAGFIQSTQGTITSAWNALLGLLEPKNAARWHCPYYQLAFNLSHINWVLAANSTTNIPAPLLSRCHVVHLDPMTREDMLAFAARTLEEDVLLDVERVLHMIPDGHPKLNMRTVKRIIEEVSAIHERPMLQ